MGNAHVSAAQVAPQECKLLAHRNAPMRQGDTFGQIDLDASLAAIAIPWHCIRLGTKLADTHAPWVSINKSWCIGPNYMTRVMVKQIDVTRLDTIALAKELQLMKQLVHPNVVKFVGVTCQGPHSYVVTECVENGDLRQCLHRIDLETHVVSLLRDIACGMAFLHTRNPPIIHQALHTGNIHITHDFRAKIANAECSRFKKPVAHPWVAPEVVDASHPFDEMADVYSFALVMAEVLGERSEALTVDLVRMYTTCLSRNPTDRPTFTRIVEQLDRLI
ncbi:TKL protein kinase [Aphanomyces invadans]|uniref:TKL protein kinase n=1 Tax=Aphanomyces invadans TaxID=157072 RepID=A0A024TAI7_9STRA|nr:TKL protein kinase [Aphanomyces invadans]ETV91053.1 TKL protein kinase [Aphanomyces invadans]|eukprot:XP_008880333.1 TKL protein kinase [Aphanomyces invadans]